MKNRILGAIDIGSNAIRLLIANVEEYSTEIQYKKIAFLRVPIRLGEDVFSDQKSVGDNKKERFVQAMKGFTHIMKAYEVENYRACATSAMREAVNGEEIVKQVKEQCGLNIDIISGQEEADILFASGMQEITNISGSYLYVDVGGGSTEITVYKEGSKRESCSFPLGTVRILNDAVDKDEFKKFKKWLKKIAKKYAPETIIGSGGNINKIQKLLNKKDKEPIFFTELTILNNYVKSFSMEDRERVLQLNPYRADVIVPAMKIFLTVAKCCKINEIIAPKLGLADGIIKQLYLSSNS